MESVKKDIGKRIEKIRNNMNMTREEFCNYTHITKQYLSMLEKGESCFSIERLIDFCNKIDISTDYVLTGKVNFYDAKLKEMFKDMKENQIDLQLQTIKNIVELVKNKIF